MTSVYQDVYGFSSGEAGLTFLGIGIGMLIGEWATQAFLETDILA
jgi:predicted MFS family arabinose efflux permease